MTAPRSSASEADAGRLRLVSTYRYLRMSFIAVLCLLLVAVLIQTGLTRPRWETSISAYYWTPVRNVFVGSVVALGVGLVVLKADSEVEDVLLNLAGVLAVLVALVPTPRDCVLRPDGRCVVPPLPAETVEGIGNNVTALLVAGGLALALYVGLTGRRLLHPQAGRGVVAVRVAGLALVVGLLVATVAWFAADRGSFERWAHIASAVAMFACIVGVTVLNGVAQWSAGRRLHSAYLWAYASLAVLMTALVVVGLLAALHPRGGSWLGIPRTHALLVVEAGVLLLFLAFWIVQSRELWDVGTRFPTSPVRLLPLSRAPRDADPTRRSGSAAPAAGRSPRR